MPALPARSLIVLKSRMSVLPAVVVAGAGVSVAVKVMLSVVARLESEAPVAERSSSVKGTMGSENVSVTMAVVPMRSEVGATEKFTLGGVVSTMIPPAVGAARVSWAAWPELVIVPPFRSRLLAMTMPEGALSPVAMMRRKTSRVAVLAAVSGRSLFQS